MHWLDPSVLPAVSGTIDRFLLNPRGEVDGVLLADARQLHVPPHLGPALEKAFAVGDPIEARYVKPRDAEVYAAVSVTSRAGRTLVDPGPPPPHERTGRQPPARRPVDLQGQVKFTLYAPRGELVGAVLESGEQLRVEPKGNAALADYFRPGADIRVWGEAFRRKGTTVVEVAELGWRRDFD